MRYLWATAILAVAFVCNGYGASGSDPVRLVRLVTYNMHGGHPDGAGTPAENLTAFRNLLQGEQILCFQEVDDWDLVKEVFADWPYTYYTENQTTDDLWPWESPSVTAVAIVSKLPFAAAHSKLIQIDPQGDLWERHAQHVQVETASDRVLHVFHFHNTYNFNDNDFEYEQSGMVKFRDYVYERLGTSGVNAAANVVMLGDYNLFNAKVDVILPTSEHKYNGRDHLNSPMTFRSSGVYATSSMDLSDHNAVWAMLDTAVEPDEYTLWEHLHFDYAERTAGATAKTGDFDGDEHSNFEEYALGGDPRRADGRNLLGISAAGSAPVLECGSYPLRRDVRVEAYHTNNLTNWTVYTGQFEQGTTNVLTETEDAAFFRIGATGTEAGSGWATSDGLYGLWPMDERYGTMVYGHGNIGYAGEFSGEPVRAISATGRRFLHFDGTDDKVVISGAPAFTNAGTFAVWAKSDTPTWNSYGMLISRRNSLVLHPNAGGKTVNTVIMHPDNQKTILSYNLANQPGFDITEWHHYACSYDASTGAVKFYADGELLAAATGLTTGFRVDTGTIELGHDRGFSGSRFFDGSLDEFRVYSRALSNAEVNTLYESPVEYSDPGSRYLTGHWKLNETAGNVAADATDICHGTYDGSLISGPVWTQEGARSFLQFDGADDQIGIDGVPPMPGSITVGGWARSDTAAWNHFGMLISRQNSFVLHPDKDNMRIAMKVWHPDSSRTDAYFDLSSIAGFSIQEWHHYMGTYDTRSGMVRLYVDGELRAEMQGLRTGLGHSTETIGIGRHQWVSGRYFDGGLSDFRIYDEALNGEEVKEVYRSTEF